MLRRRVVVGLVMALATSCSGPFDRVEAPHSTFAVSTTVPATTVPLSSDLNDLVTTTTMTEPARRMFVAASPTIEDPATFARNCGVGSEPDRPSEPRTHTQGCFVAGRIHLLAPDRPEARELLYVVAAHELLHVVYASLGPSERRRIDGELEAARPGNERLEERLEPYGSTPTLANEMHSILGSEFERLSPALEAHYARYFSNRAAVVAARQRTLGDRENEIRRLKAAVADLEARVSAMREAQEQRRLAGDIRGYNGNVAVMNQLISLYNAEAHALNARIDEYNGLLGG